MPTRATHHAGPGRPERGVAVAELPAAPAERMLGP